MWNALKRGEMRGKFCVQGWDKVNLEDLEVGVVSNVTLAIYVYAERFPFKDKRQFLPNPF